MTGLYARWMDRWEHKLATRDTNRVVRPFDWGTDWLNTLGFPRLSGGCQRQYRGMPVALRRPRRWPIPTASSPTTPVRDYRLDDENRLTFTSPVQHPVSREQYDARAVVSRAEGSAAAALIVLPQWNSGPDGHVGLAKLLNRFGISALRMTMAYHAERKPAETPRADYHVSSNVGRTIHASRQSVIDMRACLDWLEQQGYSGSEFWAPAWDRAWRSSRRRTSRASRWESSITSR